MAKKNNSESFRKLRKKKNSSSEGFGTIPYVSEGTAEHVLSVRDVAKKFENAGVPRTERSIINWCQPNHQGVSRLDCFFDTNERKYFITPVSVDRAISEEQIKLKIQGKLIHQETSYGPSENNNNDSEGFGKQSDSFGTVPKSSESFDNNLPGGHGWDVETQIRDLQIMNRAKDIYIERLENINDKMIEDLKDASHQLGELQTQIRQLERPKEPVKEAGEAVPEKMGDGAQENGPSEMDETKTDVLDMSSEPLEVTLDDVHSRHD